jgi:hypothetical protein
VAKDTYGNPMPGLSVTFTAPSTGASGTFATSSTVTTNGIGVAISPVFTANTVAGSYTITASATGATSQNFSLTNSPGAAKTIAILNGNNQSATVGAAFAKSLQVLAKDNYGNVVPGVSVVFTAPSTGAKGTFATSSTITTDSNGLATAPAFTANTVSGTYTVTAASTGLTSLNFSMTNTPGAAGSLAILDGNNQSATVNAAFVKTLQVVAKDTYGNVVPGVSVVFAAPSSGASGRFATSSTVTTNASGVAASPVFTANAVIGVYTVTAAATGLPTQNFSLTNSIGTASNLAIVDGNNQSATVGTGFGSALQVKFTDSFGNPVPGVSVTFSSPASGPGITFGGSATVVSNTSGFATSPVITANGKAGSFTVTASAANIGSVNFSLANTPGIASTIQVASGNNQSTTVNTPFGQPVVARVTDSFGNPVANVPVTFSEPGSGALAIFGGGSVVITNAEGIASSPNLAANTVSGTYTITASASNVSSAQFNLTNAAGLPTSIVKTGGNNQAAMVNSSFSTALSVKVTDTFGNPVPNVNVSFSGPATGSSLAFAGASVVSTNALGVATTSSIKANSVAGIYTVQAYVNDQVSSAFSLTNLPGTAAKLAIASGDRQFTTVNTTYSKGLQVLVTDAYNNPVQNIPVTFNSPSGGPGIVLSGSNLINTNSSGIALLDGFVANKLAGTFSVAAGVPNLPSLNFNLNNNPGAVGSLVPIAGGVQSTVINGTFAAALQVKVVDVYGNNLPDVPVTFNSPVSGTSLTFTANNLIRSDANGLVFSPTMKANGLIGSYSVTASTPGASTINFAMTNSAPKIQSMIIQQGGAGRSFVRYVDLTINDPGTVASIVKSLSGTAPKMTLTNTGLTGTTKKSVALKGLVSAIGNTVRIDFGSKGVGGNAVTNAADGSYLISLDLDGNGSLETTQRFWRLLGDVNGDKVVDAKDTNIVNANLNKSGFNIPGDTNGDGKVNSTDVSYVRTAQKRKITV